MEKKEKEVKEEEKEGRFMRKVVEKG